MLTRLIQKLWRKNQTRTRIILSAARVVSSAARVVFVCYGDNFVCYEDNFICCGVVFDCAALLSIVYAASGTVWLSPALLFVASCNPMMLREEMVLVRMKMRGSTDAETPLCGLTCVANSNDDYILMPIKRLLIQVKCWLMPIKRWCRLHCDCR